MPIVCEHCGADTRRAGHVTFPNKTIYRCGSCRRLTWIGDDKAQANPMPPEQSQPQAIQQQQQQQQQKDDE